MSSRLALVVLLAAIGGCADADTADPEWEALLQDSPLGSSSSAETWLVARGKALEIRTVQDAVWVDVTLPPSGWQPGEEAGTWWIPSPVHLILKRLAASYIVLSRGEQRPQYRIVRNGILLAGDEVAYPSLRACVEKIDSLHSFCIPQADHTFIVVGND